MHQWRDIVVKPCYRMTLFAVIAVLLAGWAAGVGAQAKPAGELNWAWHVTIAPGWFDPANAPAQVAPYLLLYALHDGLVRALPGERRGNSLAQSWTESADGLTYEFKLRQGLKFHNGDPFTAEDVKFSFERYKGSGAKELHAKVSAVEVVDPHTVRFHLKQPWPDFMTFYGSSATAAGLIVPKKYIEQVGDEGFLQHPIGLGPYKFVSHAPGVEVVMEAFEGYWRKVPNIKRFTVRGIPDVSTRLAMLKRQEADFVSALQGAAAEEAMRDSNLKVVDTRHPSIFWVEFPDQWDPKSPWADIRLRQAVNHALDRKAISDAACLGFCPPAGVIVPRLMDYALQVEPPTYDPKKAKQLLAEAGYPNGIDAGEFVPIPPFYDVSEGVVNYLNAVGIRVRMRNMERAAFLAAWREKKLRGLFMPASGQSGNAATRVEAFMYSKGQYAYGGYPDIDELVLQQSRERDQGKREALLHRIQQLTIERAMFAPVMDLRGLVGVGPRVAEHTINSIPLHPYPALEDIRLKEK
ncbi:MAG TPA: ABC transporter substrate-binding protein [Candidatus Tectomicrobia bacterium]|nr:ABC transporter substrate-binding protein [Candidatus Tectomicrobia bacterium]